MTNTLAERINLHADGYTDGQIARAQGVSRELIQSWRSRRGLPINRARKTKSKVKKYMLLFQRSPRYKTTEQERELVRRCIGRLYSLTENSKEPVTVNDISRYLGEWRAMYGGGMAR